MNASFEEKSVWIQLVAITVGLGAYFIVAGRLLVAGVTAMPAYAALFLVAMVGIVILIVAGHILAVLMARPEGRDERDRMISWRAEHNSSWLLAVGVLSGITCMAMGVENVWTANLLLLSLALSEVVGFVLRIRYYRKGV